MNPTRSPRTTTLEVEPLRREGEMTVSQPTDPSRVSRTLERLTNGDAAAEELHFDPRTGQIVVRRPGEIADPESIPATQMVKNGFFASADDDVPATLGKLADGEEPEEELFFDPATGRVVVRRPGEQVDPESIPATQMVKNGFFAGMAQLYASEARATAAELAAAERKMRRSAVLLRDDGEVAQHVLAPLPEWRRTGAPAVGLVALGGTPEARLAEWRESTGETPAHLLLLDPASPEAAQSFRVIDGRLHADALYVVPDAGEAFARNRGLLESDALADRCVAIVGLGSGGSVIASELAKAGVGRFLLVDRDRLELENVGRHLCDATDLGRRKTAAVRDCILARNPRADVRIVDVDVVKERARFEAAMESAHVLVGATDGNASRRIINRLAVETGRPAIFGRAFTRACGGDVIRVAAGGPCYECLIDGLPGDEEIATTRSANATAYADTVVRAEPGLALDIAPISAMCARLVVQELVRGTGSGLESLDDDLVAPLYFWANRREAQFSAWRPMRFGLRELSVLRWYATRAEKRPACPVCDEEGFLTQLAAQA